MKCQNCQDFKKLRRRCSAETHGECDCPKCQGMCECKPKLIKADLMDWVKDHVKHFECLPMEYAQFTDDGDEVVWTYDEYIKYFTPKQMERFQKACGYA